LRALTAVLALLTFVFIAASTDASSHGSPAATPLSFEAQGISEEFAIMSASHSSDLNAVSALAGDDDNWWDGFGSSNGLNGRAVCMTLYNNDLIVGGDFTLAGAVPANKIARWDGTSWHSLGAGLNDGVYTVTVYNGLLIAAGNFTTAGGVSASKIASWDGTVWRPLGSGLWSSGYASSTTTYGGNLVVGGYFTTAGGVNVYNIASWNGTSWQPLGSGLNERAIGIFTFDNYLYASGLFTTAGGIAVNHIARWNGSSWGGVDGGLNDFAQMFARYDNDLIAAGIFTQAGGNPVGRVASWDGTAWSALGSGVDARAFAVTTLGSTLFVAGDFIIAGGISARRIASWNGSAWASLGSGLDGRGWAVCPSADGRYLFVAGEFSTAGGKVSSRIARWTISSAPVGACCQPNGACSVTSEVGCASPGVWHGEWTSCEPNPCSDLVPPCAVSDLTGSLLGGTSVILWWTAPGDDCSEGTATEYDVRYASWAVTPENWSSATRVSGEPSPHVAGTREAMRVPSLPPSSTCYCAMKARDEVLDHWSELSNVVAITTGPSGAIVGWGDNGEGQCVPPSPNAEFVEVMGGAYHSLGLKSNGMIVGWGDNYFHQSSPIPQPNSDFVAIAAGAVHSLGLKSDGSIVAWGSNAYGQSGIPSPNADFVGIAEGEYHSLGLRSNGSVIGWGWNHLGQLDVPEPNTGFVAIAAGFNTSLGLKADGSIVAWGGIEDPPAPNTDFIAISTGWYFGLGLKSNGTIVAWGANGSGQCDVPTPNADFVAVAAGDTHSLGLKRDGTIVVWGSNDNNQYSVPPPNGGFQAIAGSRRDHSLGLSTNTAAPGGACCYPGDHCAFSTQFLCDQAGGMFYVGAPCPAISMCDQSVQACCYQDGSCTMVHPIICLADGGSPKGAGSDCDPPPCVNSDAPEAASGPFAPSVTPNPVTNACRIEYWVPTDGPSFVQIFDIAGRVVRSLPPPSHARGGHSQVWDGRDDRGAQLPGGVYIARIMLPGSSSRVRVVVIR
jgi:hypothetical protein